MRRAVRSPQYLCPWWSMLDGHEKAPLLRVVSPRHSPFVILLGTGTEPRRQQPTAAVKTVLLKYGVVSEQFDDAKFMKLTRCVYTQVGRKCGRAVHEFLRLRANTDLPIIHLEVVPQDG